MSSRLGLPSEKAKVVSRKQERTNRQKILASVTKGIRNYIDHGMASTMRNLGVPKKTGDSRRGLVDEASQKFETEISKFITDDRITFRINNAFIDAVNDYFKHHVRDHPSFNWRFIDGYIKPTTSGTKPQSKTLIARQMRKDIARQIRIQLKTDGYI